MYLANSARASGIEWLRRLGRTFRSAAWLNPEPDRFWAGTHDRGDRERVRHVAAHARRPRRQRALPRAAAASARGSAIRRAGSSPPSARRGASPRYLAKSGSGSALLPRGRRRRRGESASACCCPRAQSRCPAWAAWRRCPSRCHSRSAGAGAAWGGARLRHGDRRGGERRVRRFHRELATLVGGRADVDDLVDLAEARLAERDLQLALAGVCLEVDVERP